MSDPRRMQPNRLDEAGYAGVGLTFGRVPLVLDAAGLEGADVAIVGAPFDEGVTYRPGTRFGPRAIRTAEDVAFPIARPHMELGIDPYEELDIVDYGDVDVRPSDLAWSHAALRQGVADILGAGAIPVVLGGDHSLSTPVLEALATHHGSDGFSVVHFDTHADTGSDEREAPHGVPFYQAVRAGHLDGHNIVQIGLRGAWPFPEEFQWMREAGFRWHTTGEIVERGIGPVVRDAIEHARARAPRTYLTVDVDVLDPAFAPGTGTAEPGGLMTRELLWAVRTVACELDLCSMDVVEVSPPYDPSGITAMAAQRVVLETLSGIALRRSGRPARPARPADSARDPAGGAKTMSDSEILNRIDELVAEEHRLYDKEGSGDFEPGDRVRLDEVGVALDRCWDLLRQRRARREFGLDPDEAQARSADVVEHYEQ